MTVRESRQRSDEASKVIGADEGLSLKVSTASADAAEVSKTNSAARAKIASAGWPSETIRAASQTGTAAKASLPEGATRTHTAHVSAAEATAAAAEARRAPATESTRRASAPESPAVLCRGGSSGQQPAGHCDENEGESDFFHQSNYKADSTLRKPLS